MYFLSLLSPAFLKKKKKHQQTTKQKNPPNHKTQNQNQTTYFEIKNVEGKAFRMCEAGGFWQIIHSAGQTA